ncbi:glutaredoxin family protein [Glaciimonas immobilis]|nr:glutaredoxin family protein [Glaciimonas immobilis]
MVCLLASSAAQGQLYKSIGADGHVTYSDTPPKNGNVVVKKSLDNNNTDVSELPYDLAQANKGNPVVLYTANNCVPCDDGRTLLNVRGVPYKEKTISTNEDIARLKAVGGGGQLPFLLIGRNKQNGFEAVGWQAAISAAGYPQENRLPKNYRNGAKAPAAPPVKSRTDDTGNDNSDPNASKGASLPAPISAPPGFRF